MKWGGGGGGGSLFFGGSRLITLSLVPWYLLSKPPKNSILLVTSFVDYFLSNMNRNRESLRSKGREGNLRLHQTDIPTIGYTRKKIPGVGAKENSNYKTRFAK
eukprot:TRINITY_DN3860_c0_g1_i1.p1 TRINITY_DN3860_c0_g1~~TRINITY_DN3860_c0_g1_i1.p1  ORF type:complete len:103 (-),score=13.78 TRINITY_DN3860_c0_g1_i1:366-674(-)